MGVTNVNYQIRLQLNGSSTYSKIRLKFIRLSWLRAFSYVLARRVEMNTNTYSSEGSGVLTDVAGSTTGSSHSPTFLGLGETEVADHDSRGFVCARKQQILRLVGGQRVSREAWGRGLLAEYSEGLNNSGYDTGERMGMETYFGIYPIAASWDGLMCVAVSYSGAYSGCICIGTSVLEVQGRSLRGSILQHVKNAHKV